MKRFLAILMVLTAATIAHAEPRWCSITGKGPNDKVLYPPIAKIARVNGLVLSRIIYRPNGKVEKVENISGPPMLVRFLAAQMMDWNIKTDASGEQLCETLVIAKYQLNEPSGCDAAPEQEPKPIDVSTPSILRLELSASPIPTCDPGADIILRNPLQQLGHAIKRGFTKAFRAKQ